MSSGRRLFDSHFHVIDHRFPLVANQGYAPPPFSLADYRSAANPLGVQGGAVVSGSFQAFDQSYLLAALAALGPGWVGVTQIPEDCPDAEIARLGAAGVRAVEGRFDKGECVRVLDPEGREIARGLVRYESGHAARICGLKSEAIEAELGARYVSFDELLETADVVSLHCPLNAETQHLINADRLKQMRSDAFLINTTDRKSTRLNSSHRT